MKSPDLAPLYLLGLRGAGRVPGPLLRGACNLGADVAWLRHGSGVRQLERNLRRVRPWMDDRELRRLSRAGMRSYIRYFGEAFAVGSLTREQILARVRVVGRENVQPSLDEGRTVVAALGHMGNWDLAGAWGTVDLAPVTTVAERLKPEELFQAFLRFREDLGMRIIPLAPGGEVFRELLRVARTGPGLLPLLADRDLTARGVEVDLFDERARVAAGPAALAVSTGAPLVAISVHYERLHGERRRVAGSPWGVVVTFHPPVVPPTTGSRREQVAVTTQRWVDQLAGTIENHPEDWHMLQKVFVADLDPERYAATVAASEAER
ncbi:phosphatidylinositol mannoside acyltransferase [Cellulomonas sp. P22]|uniref:phosphatidylinositol mannoside acyltransferase n=1 Tax=Cellulomonas sp. P22 TaxID=3373189 RepID=UPI0037A311DA